MPIGVGADGTAYHINSDAFAGELARTLHAEKLILMTNVPASTTATAGSLSC
jgi:acetylglutamate kinase